MRKKLAGVILGGMILFLFSAAYGQSYVESALLFSRTTPGGSARIQGMGGAQISLGGDYSSALSNPAGLGMYNRSELTFSPGYKTSTTSASFLGNATDEIKTSLNVPGLSLVFNMPRDNRGFLGGSLAITMSRINDFNGTTIYEGLNENTSIIDYFRDDAFGSTTAQFDPGNFQYNTPTGLAFYNYLIGPLSLLDANNPNDEYFSDVEGIPFQQEEIATKGATNQWSISYGGNYEDRIFFGGGIGITSLRYTSSKTFTEDFNDPIFNNLALAENLEIRGSGINATLGVIARPIDMVQVGVSFTTPTYYSLSETYSASMSTSWNNFDYYQDGSEILTNESAATDIVTSDYSLTTPLKFSAGASFISKIGLLSADVEFVNPANAKYGSNISGIDFSGDNDGIKSGFQSAVNFRVGGELRHEIFRFRAGYGIQGNTIREEFNTSNEIQTFSGGLGIRTQNFFIDLAVVHNRGEEQPYNPYSFQVYDFITPVVNIKNKITTAILTVGFTF